ncbi:SDR family oxidoreductase [Verminephrobacter eiseniae]|uniref:SDR family oxidoreductase n=1 Tax=Verminephrobacter eiseniae TaxID=364317 RepID=UPI0022385138|nr:SDR family oxidoreductase [Verminephrobacter eiseniae]MCW5236307.1 SDR family oxidoreductase [Verminephrobacter eiseniae]
MDLGIANKRALVLSASGGLGSAIAVALAREGATVCLAGRNEQALAAAAQRVRATGATAHSFVWDLAHGAQWSAGIASVLQRVGGIDILVNNTGGPPPGPAHGHAPDIWRNAFESMVLSVIGITDLLLPGMRERGWGRVITSTSSGVVAPIVDLGLSNATRISLLGWSKALAREVAGQGVTVNVLIPGRIATARTLSLDSARARREGRDLAAVEAESAATIALGRYGRPEEYADAVAFLASERAAYITGTTLRVDGGLIASI